MRRLATLAACVAAVILTVYGAGAVSRWVASPLAPAGALPAPYPASTAPVLARTAAPTPGSAATPGAATPSPTGDPLAPTAETIALGRRLYMQNCAFCHGPGGRGDGRAAAGLVPRPTDLTSLAARRLSDARMFQILSAGVPKTAMPAWGSSLDPGQRWAIVSFIRAELQP